MPRTIICRTGWCPCCHNLGQPHKDNLFLVWGNNGMHIYTVQKQNPLRGYTPHLYRLMRVDNDDIVFERLCGICGVTFKYNKSTHEHDPVILENKWKREKMSIKDWNALVMYKRDLDYLI